MGKFSIYLSVGEKKAPSFLKDGPSRRIVLGKVAICAASLSIEDLISGLLGKISFLEAKSVEFGNRASDAESKLAQLEKSIDISAASVGRIADERRLLQEEKKEIEALKASMNVDVQSAVKEANDKADAAEAEMIRIKSDADAVKKELDDAKQASQPLRDQIKDLEEQVSDLGDEIDDLTEFETKCHELESKMQLASRDLSGIVAKVQDEMASIKAVLDG